MRYWKCTCCSTVLVTQKLESKDYCRPTCPMAACAGSNYHEISLDEFKTIALAGENSNGLSIGFPLNDKAEKSEKYARLTIDGYEAKFAMTGISAIVNALKAGLNMESLSTSFVKEAIEAFELLHKRMWELCEGQDVTQNNHTGDVATCFACNSPLPPQDTDVALDERMKRAGMMTVAEVLNSPMAKFQVHAGVKDLDTFNEWLIMRRDSFTRQQAKYRLADKVEGDMFEWTVAHSACFREVFYNFEVAKTVNDKLIAELKEQIDEFQALIKKHINKL